MGISVEGYGNITQSNAKEIYLAYRRGEVELNASQQKKCESFLQQEDLDEIEYDDGVKSQKGKDKINTDGTEKETTANVAATSVGGSVFAAGAVALLKLPIYSTVYGALAGAIGMTACSAGALICAKQFDNAYKERTAAKEASEQSNQTMDQYAESLTNTMDMMNEDVELYQAQQQNLTAVVNTQTSDAADAQMEYDTAMAMGDVKGAQAAKEKMDRIKGADNSQLEAELEETGGALDEYRAMNTEAMGVSESGASVAEFLKEGTAIGVVAALNATLLAAATILTAIDAAKCVAAIKTLWDIPVALAAVAFLCASAIILGFATTEMIGKTKGEFECASSGKDMQDHVDSLNDMIEQQSSYTVDTEGQFAESDEAAAESQENAAGAANDAVSGHNENVLGGKKKEKEEAPAA